MNGKKRSPVIVIGAGMAGLAAARHLIDAGIPVRVLEARTRVGGRVFTDWHGGMEIDAGAQFIANFYTHTMDMIRDLGLESDLVRIPGTAAVLRGGRIHGIWPDLRLLFTPLISFWSKLLLVKPLLTALRYWSDLDVHAFYKAHRLDNQSVAAYALQHLNEEILEYVLQPPLSGIFYWRPEHTSKAFLFPLFKVAAGIKLFTLRHGLGQLSGAMAQDLPVQLESPVEKVTPDGSGGYHVQIRREGGVEWFSASGVVCAVPSVAVSGIIPNLNPRQRAFFGDIAYSANAITAIGILRRLPADFYGLLTPRQELDHLAIAAVQSAKNPHQVPPEQDLLVLYPNGTVGRRLFELEDAAVRKILVEDLAQLGDSYLPGEDETFFRVYRWRQALPIFDVGHLRRLKGFQEGGIETGRMVFAGDYLGGPFVEGAVTSGLNAARRLLPRLSG